jgi:hypothetical protein
MRRANLYLAAVCVIVLVTTAAISGSPWTTVEPKKDASGSLNHIRYCHFHLLTGDEERIVREAWVEYDENDKAKNIRVDLSDRKQSLVWSMAMSQCWFSEENELVIFVDTDHTDKMLSFAGRHHPRRAVDYTRDWAARGGIKVTISDTADANSIQYTVSYDPNTYLVGAPKPAMRDVIHVGSASGLVQSIDSYMLYKGQFRKAGTWVYTDYNRPVDPNIFDLRDKVSGPQDILDTRTMEFGLAKEGCSGVEIAARVVEEFLEAWKAEAYERALTIHGYYGSKQKRSLGRSLSRLKLVEIIEVGRAHNARRPLRGFTVPCVLELSRTGEPSTKQVFDFQVRSAVPGRWQVAGFRPRRSAVRAPQE